MANKVKKTEGGQGGGRGHSNMTHWQKTEEIKRGAKKARRTEARETILRETERRGEAGDSRDAL